MKEFTKEELRIRTVYAKRDEANKQAFYSWYQPDTLVTQFRFSSVAAHLLVKSGLTDLASIEVLDVGCGFGSWLRNLCEWGASAERLHGIDLLEDRIEKARIIGEKIDYKVASGYSVPFRNDSMDLVTAHTVFSSVLSSSARKYLAYEMYRVLKPKGRIFIFDYRISDPRNSDTVGIRKPEIMKLFPGFNIMYQSLLLAPPLSRRIAALSPFLVNMIDVCLPFLRTHAIFLLTRQNGTD
jgi:ubiquinone/menaquinone biosynthesis C-methylase UbiE